MWFLKYLGIFIRIFINCYQFCRDFYGKRQSSQDFSLSPQQFKVGMRIVIYFLDQWDRAEVMSEVNPSSGKVRLFFIDYGTMESLHFSRCRLLLEEYASIPRKSFRGALYGVKPVGDSRLWNLHVTTKFINSIRNKVLRIQIMKYHESVS